MTDELERLRAQVAAAKAEIQMWHEYDEEWETERSTLAKRIRAYFYSNNPEEARTAANALTRWAENTLE